MWIDGGAALWIDHNLLKNQEVTNLFIFVAIISSDGIENKIQGWNYFCHTHSEWTPYILCILNEQLLLISRLTPTNSNVTSLIKYIVSNLITT